MEIQSSGRPIDVLMEKVLSVNILSSDYFKELYRLKTYHEVIDEIYNQVDHVEPWMTGNCRGPSSAFCLLYKFFTMKLTVKQMHGLLKHPDSPYIRAVHSEQKRYYFDSLLPRVPLPILRQVTGHLEKMKLPTKQSGITGDSSRLGSDDTARRPPSVKASLSVSFGQRAPHRASTRDSSPVRKTLPSARDRERSSDGECARSSPRRRRSRSHERDHDSERDRSDRDRGRHKDREHDRHAREDRDRDYRRSSYSSRNVDRQGRERRDRDSDRHGRSSARRSRSRSPNRGRTEGENHRSSPFGRPPEPSNLAKLKDLYGDATNTKDDTGDDKARRDSGTEEQYNSQRYLLSPVLHSQGHSEEGMSFHLLKFDWAIVS
ncbi:hypothetical protein OsJ_20096 [Oryza sativa Japonica Group]|uniref:Pre-mRNA-splicing factor 38 n=1 Tax=Oryza sativa subsp. japonica TaxID=39947 RepID=B9FRG0_ORYSJ|nr:hypothetical protein OsJ_20096 [Oryza sativa Japonica Group]